MAFASPGKLWREIDGDQLRVLRPDLYRQLVQLIRYVYQERGRSFHGMGYDHTVQVAYKLADPSNSYVQLAEGLEGSPAANMVYSISTRYKSVKNKLEPGEPHEPLGTTKFDHVLDDLNTWVHASHAVRLEE
ncbi:hypothetical protein WJX72_011427 [[Myrmecia] bisecta]|uniref:Uncharacterized protein n=1 Tax=[Myrmecia] bisecta TaxID=41462 RepID=A0AAW1PMI6_9CHLO